MLEIYGQTAAAATLSCPDATHNDDRTEDYEFWTAVLACLEAARR